ncbi:hypothetical protein D3C79_1031100 [compost metagenome]
MAFVPDVEHFLASGYVHDFGQGVGLGEDLGFPGVVAAFDGQPDDHGFEVGAGVVDVLHFGQ